MGGAHVLELPEKMKYDAEMYAAVTSTLYQQFGTVGAIVQVGAVASALALIFVVRGRDGFALTIAGTIGLVVSLACWFAFVAPVNAEWLQVAASDPQSVPEAYMRLRDRWEYGHAAAFAAWLCGFWLLLLSVLVETSDDARRM